jgi:hypothetical protein
MLTMCDTNLPLASRLELESMWALAQESIASSAPGPLPAAIGSVCALCTVSNTRSSSVQVRANSSHVTVVVVVVVVVLVVVVVDAFPDDSSVDAVLLAVLEEYIVSRLVMETSSSG